MLRRIQRAFVVADYAFELLIRGLASAGGVRRLLYILAIPALALMLLQSPAALWQDARELYRAGCDAIASREYVQAARDLKRAVRLAPKETLYAQQYAHALILAGEPARAVDVLQKSFRKDPSRATLYLIGSAHQQLRLYQAAIGYFNEGKVHNAAGETWNRESPQLYERAADTKIGECYVQMKQYQKAIHHLNLALSLHPKAPYSAVAVDPGVYFYLGVAHWAMGRQELALQYFHKTLAVRPEDSVSLYNIACYHAVHRQSDDAMAYLERAVAAGFDEPEYLDHDPDMDNVRHLARYRRIADQVRARASAIPAVGSRSPEAVSVLVDELKSRRAEEL